MRTKSPPAFQFYPGDRLQELMPILSDNEAVGAWIKAVMYLWGTGPSSTESIGLVVGSGWVRVGFLFAEKNGLLYLEWMEEKRAETLAFRDRQRKNGSKGGRPKVGHYKDNNPTLTHGLTQTKAKKSPRVEGEEEREGVGEVEKKEKGKTPFMTWWDLYEYKGSKKLSSEAWEKMSEVDRVACIANTPAYISSKPDKQYRRDGERFLKNRTWEDDVTTTKQPTAPGVWNPRI